MSKLSGVVDVFQMVCRRQVFEVKRRPFKGQLLIVANELGHFNTVSLCNKMRWILLIPGNNYTGMLQDDEPFARQQTPFTAMGLKNISPYTTGKQK